MCGEVDPDIENDRLLASFRAKLADEHTRSAALAAIDV